MNSLFVLVRMGVSDLRQDEKDFLEEAISDQDSGES